MAGRSKADHVYKGDPGWDWERQVSACWDRVVVYDGAEARRAGIVPRSTAPWVIAYYAIEPHEKPPTEPIDAIGASGQKRAREVATEIAERRATMSDHGGHHTWLPVKHEAMPIVILDPARAGEALVSALDQSVTPQDIAKTVKGMLSANKVIVDKEGVPVHEQPDWTAREKALRFYADYLVGRPTQRTEMRLNQGNDDGGDIIEKMKGNPSFMRAMVLAMKDADPESFAKIMEGLK